MSFTVPPPEGSIEAHLLQIEEALKSRATGEQRSRIRDRIAARAVVMIARRSFAMHNELSARVARLEKLVGTPK